MPDKDHPIDHSGVDVAATVDCIGLRCPLPVLKAQKRLEGLHQGAVVEVLSTDPVALVDIPHMARERGHELIEQGVSGDVARFLIRRG